MLATLRENAALLSAREAQRHRYILMVLPRAEALADVPGLPFRAALEAALQRRRKAPIDLAKSCFATETADGTLVAWCMDDAHASTFDRLSLLRKAAQLLLAEAPREIAIAVFGSAAARKAAAPLAAYVASLNGAPLPHRKRKSAGEPLAHIHVYGHDDQQAHAPWRAIAEGNALCRELTVLPPNELTPAAYRARLNDHARRERWGIDQYDVQRLRRMRAGAFLAVAQGSDEADAAIVRLSYRPRGAARKIALVGKGICFDTGGHNLKPAKYMSGMHHDMNGSAVALGILLAATRARLPVRIDCWLALAQNHIGPRAYKQNEIVTALNGTTIEIVHTDAEGRMVLADTLTLAAREKPDLIVDFATLTGSMHVALGNRYSGIFGTSAPLAQDALAAGDRAAERVCAFPMDEDYDEALESTVADVKQCTLEGEADHILAARFLRRFTGDRPWIHMDLSAATCKGGLGALATEVTGFGVAWGYFLLEARAAR